MSKNAELSLEGGGGPEAEGVLPPPPGLGGFIKGDNKRQFTTNY